MTRHDAREAPPSAAPRLDGDGCPECGHNLLGRRSKIAQWIAGRFGRSLRPHCPYALSSAEAESGEGLPSICGCKHPFHG